MAALREVARVGSAAQRVEDQQLDAVARRLGDIFVAGLAMKRAMPRV